MLYLGPLFGFVEKEPEYRDHIVNVWREGDHWVAHYALPDHSTPEYRQPNPRPKTKFSGGFLHGPFRSKAAAIKAVKRKIDENIVKPDAQ